MDLGRVQGVIRYSVFKYEPLHNLQLEIFESVRECTVNYVSSDRLRTKRGQRIESLLKQD